MTDYALTGTYTTPTRQARTEPADEWPRHNDRTEPAAPYCNGPGPLYGPRPVDQWGIPGQRPRLEDCPACVGQVRNHRDSRYIEAIEAAAS